MVGAGPGHRRSPVASQAVTPGVAPGWRFASRSERHRSGPCRDPVRAASVPWRRPPRGRHDVEEGDRACRARSRRAGGRARRHRWRPTPQCRGPMSAVAAGPDDTPAALGDSPVLAYLQRVLERHRSNRAGAVARYIPELGRADPAAFGIVIATVDGAVYEAGDTRTPFTIQSISKPLTYAADPRSPRRGRRPARGSASSRRARRSTAITLETGAGIAAQPDGQRGCDHRRRA